MPTRVTTSDRQFGGNARQVRTLVGRARELEVLHQALADTIRGQRGVVFVTGEPGIGKTRLLEDWVEKSVAAGVVVAWGRVLEVGLTPPFWPWIQVLHSLQIDGERVPNSATFAPCIDTEARFARFAEVCSLITRRAQAAPLIIVLDDLHAADPSSLQLLEYLLPQLLGRRVLFALASRDADATGDIATALGRIQRTAIRLPLRRLEQPEVVELVGARADASRIFELSDGNPLFVEELVASQSTRGALGLPKLSSARSVIQARVAQLPEATEAALIAGALLGREFRGTVVADMLALPDASGHLEPAVSLGIVSLVGADNFRFSHALVAETLHEGVSASERSRLHLAAARSLEQRDPGNPNAIAHQLLSAGNSATLAAIAAARRAAQMCIEQLAFEDAAAVLERALHALRLADPMNQRERAELLCECAQPLQHSTQHAKAAQMCDEAAAIARAMAKAGDPEIIHEAAELFARAALTRGLEFRFGHPNPVLIALLSEALDRLGPHSQGLRAKVLARLAAAEQPAKNPNEPVARALAAIELARTLSDRERLDVMYVATSALVEYVDAERLESVHREVLQLARGNDKIITVHTQLRLCFTALERLDRHGFDGAVHAFTVEAEALELPQWNRHVHMLHAMTALLEGRFDDAESEAERADEIAQTLGDTSAGFLMDVHRSIAAWVRTTPVDPARKARIGDYAPGRAAVSAWLAEQEGSRERARAAIDELAGHVPIDPDLSSMVGSAAAYVGDVQLATHVYEALVPRSGRIVLASVVGSALMDLFDRVLLVLAAAARLDTIEFHGERALAIAGKLGSPVWTARVEVDFAAALLKRNQPGDSERAECLRVHALSEATRLKMPGLIERCLALAAHAEVPSTLLATSNRMSVEHQSAHLKFAKQGGLWSLCGFGEQVFVKDSRGIQMIAMLVAHSGTPLHALELAGVEQPIDGGDAGPALDTQARDEYRKRASNLRAELERAEAMGDLGQAERARAEIEALTQELERAFGLGGRNRRVGAISERARSNAQRRIAHSLSHIRSVSPRIAEHLAATIRTGTYCVYEPIAP